ncbi:hypothetical protein PhCBS80983_g02190 [Powellomyces hirtus]|uniref:Ribosome biogenesis protein NSA1 n=1 Tax=Powellomyces hirtus TaxID=109895 RepID=A0A507E7L9_9FUNG|nr:hypothetical protein PhCBS80983_g02190 [Powellomyces hirtus]
MRYITGDEVGLSKVTIVPEDQRPAEPASRPSKKRRDDKPDSKKDEPAKPTTTTLTFGSINRNAEVQMMCWAGPEPHTAVVVARKNGVVQYLDLDNGNVLREHVIFVPQFDQEGKPIVNKYKKPEHFVGLWDVNGTLIVCTDLGLLHIIPPPSETAADTPTVDESGLPFGTFTFAQDLIFRTRVHPQHPHLLATGGDERDLTLWNLREQKLTADPQSIPKLASFWTAKNVKNDFLNIRVPVWITEILFLDSSETRIMTGTGHHQIRVYDTAKARRPIININVGTHPIRAIAASHVENAEDEIVKAVVSDTTGQLMQINVDLQGTSAKVAGKYAGLSGAVTDVAIPKGTGTVVTVGLDRFVKVFELEDDRKLVSKVYLKQRLNCVLVDDPEATESGGPDGEAEGGEVRHDESEEEDDEVWGQIEEVVVEDQEEKKASKKSFKSKESNGQSKSKQLKRKKTA